MECNPLLEAAVLMSDCSIINSNDNTEGIEEYSFDINKNSTRAELLDAIMLYLCQRIELKFSAFRGDYVLTKLLPDITRATKDIEFLISEEGQYSKLRDVLYELGDLFISRGIAIDYVVKDTITPTSSSGIQINMGAGIPNLKIDVGWHDLSWGITKWTYEGFNCDRFEVERMLADKISAIYSRKRFRRTKDIYDFFILTNNFKVDMIKLHEYVNRRGLIDWDADPFKENVLVEYSKAYDKLDISTVDGSPILKPEFSLVIERLQWFMNNYNFDGFCDVKSGDLYHNGWYNKFGGISQRQGW